MALSPIGPQLLQQWMLRNEPPAWAPRGTGAPVTPGSPSAPDVFVQAFADAPRGGGGLPATHRPASLPKFTPPPPPRSFFELPSPVQNAVYHEMKQWPKDSPTYKNIVNLATSRDFLALPGESQIRLAQLVSETAGNKGSFDQIKKLIRSPDFATQDGATQAVLAGGLASDGAGGDPIGSLKTFVDRSEFIRAPKSVRAELAKVWAEWPSNTDGQDRALALASDRKFKALPEDIQARAMRSYNVSNDPFETDIDAGRRANIEKLVKSPEFAALAPREQTRWLDALADPDTKIRKTAHERLEGIWNHTKGWSQADATKYLGRRAGAVREQEEVPATRDPMLGAATDEPTVKKSALKESDKFIGAGKKPAVAYEVTFGDQTINVTLPKKAAKGSAIPTIDQIVDGLKRMPASARGAIKEIVVEPKSKDDTLMAADHPSMGIHMFPGSETLGPAEFAGTLVHESGHLLAAKLGSKIGDPGWQKWVKAIETDDKWPSFYASHSLQEDVAETVAMYHQVKGTAAEKEMAAKFPARYQLVKDLLGQ